MNYIIKLIKSLREIIIIYIIQYLIIILLSLLYIKVINNNIEFFINNYCPYILIVIYIILIIYLYRKKHIEEQKIKKEKIYPYISLGISISCLLNMIIFTLNKQPTINNKISPILLLISSGFIGPIFEEILFRYIFYNNLKEFNSSKASIIINSILFSLIHLTTFKIFFSFILGLVLTIIYEKKGNILFPILIHISANCIALLLDSYSITILVLSIVLLCITIINIKKEL